MLATFGAWVEFMRDGGLFKDLVAGVEATGETGNETVVTSSASSSAGAVSTEE